MVGAWGALGLALAWFVYSGAKPDRAGEPSCEPIAFSVVGDAIPELATSELAVAMAEIRERTGLVFEKQPEGTGPAKLSIAWTADGTRTSNMEVTGDHGGRARRLGYATASWRHLGGGRELASAVIEINGGVAWRAGVDVDNGLAAVFVHELGHVVGLPHDADPASFMHHRTGGEPTVWTEAEKAALARFGQLSGCQPAPSAG